MRALRRSDFATCSVHIHPNIVTGDRIARDLADPIRSITPASHKCDLSAFTTVATQITDILQQVSPRVPYAQRKQWSADLDYLHFSDGWQSCVGLTESLLLISETDTVETSTVCNVMSGDTTDPCCSFEGLAVAGQCISRPVSLPQTTYQLNMVDTCQDSACLATYLEDYITTVQSSCLFSEMIRQNLITIMTVCSCEYAFAHTCPAIRGVSAASPWGCWLPMFA